MKKLLLILGTLSLVVVSSVLVVVVSCSSKTQKTVMKGSLNRGAVTAADIKKTISDIKVYEGKTTPTTSDKDNLITALNKTSFTGLLATDIPNYVISYIETSGSETITLTANSGFTFTLGTKLISKAKAADVELKGSLRQGAVTAADILKTILDIKAYEKSQKAEGDKDNLITALNKTSFTGLLAADIPKYKITYTETDGSETITLTTNSGFTFESGAELVSTIGVVMPGAIKTGRVTSANIIVTITAVKTYKGIITPTANDKDILITALNKTSFTGLLAADIPKYKITFGETPGSETITLTPNKGFRFLTGTPLISTEQLVQFTGDILNKSDLMDIGFDKKTTITLEDWKNWAPNVKQLGTQINEIDTSSTAPFDNNTTLKSIVIPKTIEIIGTRAFNNTELNSITFEAGSTLKTISTNAFKTCYITNNFTLPDSVTHLYKEAFSGINLNGKQFIINPSSSLTNLYKDIFWNASNISNMIHIPDTVTTLDTVSFGQTTNLTSGFSISGKFRTSASAMYGFNQDQWDSKITWRPVKFMGDILNKSDIFSILWDKKTIITLEDWKNWAPNVKQLGTQINDTDNSTTATFDRNIILKSIVIPKTIEIIGTWAFGNTILDSITFEADSTLKTISTNAFKNSSIKDDFTLPNSVTHLYKEAFSGVNLNGKQFIINPSSSLTNLYKDIFWSALNISNTIYIPDTVTTIDPLAFKNTTSLIGFSINSTWNTGSAPLYGFDQNQWNTKITWRSAFYSG